MPVICVDLSRYQQGFDFPAFKASGGLGVICKATEGSTLQDSSYQTFRKEALAAGLKFASYHFLRPGDMRKQARFYLQHADPQDGERVVADHEDYGVSINELIEFLDEIRDEDPSLQLTVYGGNVLEEQLGGKPNEWLADNTSLWTAAYASAPGAYPSQVWPQWSLWQYSGSGSVPGFTGDVDLNVFNGPNSQFLKWMSPAAAADPAAPVVAIAVSAGVRLLVNGKEIDVSASSGGG
jgi:GH25 family lysozyme M1 (1,4-beta-N-acetylmuramidase)